MTVIAPDPNEYTPNLDSEHPPAFDMKRKVEARTTPDATAPWVGSLDRGQTKKKQRIPQGATSHFFRPSAEAQRSYSRADAGACESWRPGLPVCPCCRPRLELEPFRCGSFRSRCCRAAVLQLPAFAVKENLNTSW